MEKHEIVKYKTDTVELDIRVSLEENTVWLTKEQIGVLFDRDRTTISRHINSIYKNGELDENTSVHFLHISPGKPNPNNRPPEYYNLDVILAIGSRVKSKNGLLLKEWFDSYIFSKKQRNHCL